MDWNGAALTLMPLLCTGLDPGWITWVWEAGGSAVDGGGCSVKGMEAYRGQPIILFAENYLIHIM